jgi:DNA-binding NtrC family response regulator
VPTLLIVDDESRVLSSLVRALRREGFEIVTAESAGRAVRLLEERRVEAVLSDYKMPGRDGLDLLAEVARRWPGTARFLITGWADDADPAALRAARVQGVFAKPWDVEELREALRGALCGR